MSQRFYAFSQSSTNLWYQAAAENFLLVSDTKWSRTGFMAGEDRSSSSESCMKTQCKTHQGQRVYHVLSVIHCASCPVQIGRWTFLRLWALQTHLLTPASKQTQSYSLVLCREVAKTKNKHTPIFCQIEPVPNIKGWHMLTHHTNSKQVTPVCLRKRQRATISRVKISQYSILGTTENLWKLYLVSRRCFNLKYLQEANLVNAYYCIHKSLARCSCCSAFSKASDRIAPSFRCCWVPLRNHSKPRPQTYRERSKGHKINKANCSVVGPNYFCFDHFQKAYLVDSDRLAQQRITKV